MEILSKYRCPACDKTIFNRRIPNCEFCGASLPSELLYSQDDLDDLKNTRERLRARRPQSGRPAEPDPQKDLIEDLTEDLLDFVFHDIDPF